MANDSNNKNVFPRVLLGLLIVLLAARFISLSLYPLLGTTEPRYAELARKMLATGDWVTLWVSDGVPLWGKPPLLFWTDALSMAVFGVNELGARFAPFCAALLLLSLFWFWWTPSADGHSRWLSTPALIAALIYLSTPMGFLSVGFVATDVYLTGGLMLSMLSFWRVVGTSCAGNQLNFWHWGFFIGIAIGLLAKGPLAVILLGLSMLLWLIIAPRERISLIWRSLPWLRGMALTLTLTLPWYLLAEYRTPGFLYHFIIGEHFERFLVKGWNGGRFAPSHAEELGMIWWFFVESFVPWTAFSLLALVGLRKTSHTAGKSSYGATLANYFKSSEVQYLLAWILSSLLLFTLSRNILEAYVLPTLPAFAILLAQAITRLIQQRPAWRWSLLLSFVMPATIMVVIVFFNQNLETQSQRHLLRHWQTGTPLVYIGQIPSSAIFYSSNQAQAAPTWSELPKGAVTVVVANSVFDALPPAARDDWVLVERYDDYSLLRRSATIELIRNH